MEAGTILLGKYRVERELGRGGMGLVVLAHHLELDERVAIKFLLGQLDANGELVARFMREAKAAVKIKSEHVARVLDVGRSPDGAPYMVLEYLEGEDLSSTSQARGPMPAAEAVEYVLQACEALAEAHALGIVHRDVKPANMFLTKRADGSPCVKVLDFGISKLSSSTKSGLTQTHGLMGSPLYMSPEQYRSPKDVDARSDVYSLGVVLYELLSRQWPVLGETQENHMYKVLNEPPAALAQHRPDLPSGLVAAVMRALQKDRASRFQSIAEFVDALAPYASAQAQVSVRRVSAVLGRASAAVPPPKETVVSTATPTPSLPSATIAATTAVNFGGTAPPAPARSKSVPVTLVAVLGLTVVGVGIFVGTRPSEKAPASQKTETTPTPKASTPSPPEKTAQAAPETATVASTSSAPSLKDPPAAPKASVLGPAVPLKVAPPKPSVSASTAVPPPSTLPAPNCAPPYVIDEQGHKVPKPECL